MIAGSRGASLFSSVRSRQAAFLSGRAGGGSGLPGLALLAGAQRHPVVLTCESLTTLGAGRLFMGSFAVRFLFSFLRCLSGSFAHFLTGLFSY